MEPRRIRLKVLGLSAGQIKQGAYALLLGQADGPVRIPVVIGALEANSIAARLENVVTRRPLVHDLFTSMAHGFGIAVQEVFIHKFEDGAFHSDVVFTDGERRVTIDARTSDAIAIAMRCNAPIYTTPEILHECGFVIENEHAVPLPSKPLDPAEATLEELEQMLSDAVAAENYEEAARISAEIARKKETDRE